MDNKSNISIELRKVFKNTLEELIENNRNIVYLENDLAGAIGTDSTLKEYPEQAFDVGIMEANSIGVASGMSLREKIPFVHSFGTFATRRCADQIFLSACFNHANIKIIGSDPGISAESNGGTHMPFEDMAVLRAFPEIIILDIAEPILLKKILLQAAEQYGVMYFRFPRKNVDSYYDENSTFQIGKGVLLREGSDISIIASGLEVSYALKAAECLEREGVSAEVIDMFTIKPIDAELIIQSAQKTGAVITAENHNIIGGLGSAVSEVLCEHCPVPMKRIGVNDSFGEVGRRDYLADKFGLTQDYILKAAHQLLSTVS